MCFGVDHPPFEVENPGGNSVLIKALSFAGVAQGAGVFVAVDGPDGQLSGSAVVDDSFRADVLIGIFSFGTYTVTDAGISSTSEEGETTTADLQGIVGDSFTVSSEEVPCSSSQLAEGSPPAAEEPTTTHAPTTTEAPVTVPAPREAVDDGDGGFPWIGVVFAGLGLFVLGLLAWWLGRDPCEELRRRWQRLQKECDEANREAQEAEQAAADARERRQRAEQERDRLCDAYPPACGGESWVEDAETGRRVTNTDLWVERSWARQAWDRYADSPGPEQAQKTEEAWEHGPSEEFREQKLDELEQARERKRDLDEQVEDAERAEEEAERKEREARERADEACAQAADARRAYEECVEARKEPGEEPGEEAEEEPGEEPGDVGVGTATDTATPPSEGDPCEGQDPRTNTLERFGPRTLVVDFRVTVTAMGYRRVEEAKRLEEELGALGDRLDQLGTALGARGALSAALRGDKTGAAVGGGGLITGLPTSPSEVITEVLEQTAKLGSLVAGKAAEWTARHELYRLDVRLRKRRFDLAWVEVWRCEDGVWKCQRVLDSHVGEPFWVSHRPQTDLMLDEVEREARAAAQRISNRVDGDLRALNDFLTKYSEGPCS